MSSRFLFVLVIAMLVSYTLAIKCHKGNVHKGKANTEETDCKHNTCINNEFDDGNVKKCGDADKCKAPSEKKEIGGGAGQKGRQGTQHCCEGNLCNGSKSSSIAVAALVSLLF